MYMDSEAGGYNLLLSFWFLLVELNKHVEEYQKRYPQTQRRIDGSEMPPINGLLSVPLGIGKTYL